MMKFTNTDSVERFAMANCAMILNSRAESRSFQQADFIFKCKRCKRRFASTQALGGHAAAHHKRHKLRKEKKLPKAYNCSVCSAQFLTGQALGGHMRKHRAPKIPDFLGSNESVYNNSSNGHSDELKMVTSNCFGKRILGLDLNLSPEENEVKLFDF